MEKSPHVEYPVADLIKNRRSIRAFASDPIDSDKVNSLFEATRWAPSSTNEQPWAYLYATAKSDFWEKMFEPLNDSNKIWAKDVPLLILSVARQNFTRYPGTNMHALYDLGAANALLSLQAVELGLQVRQMAGYDHDMARRNMNIPDQYLLGVFIAVGYPGDPGTLPQHLQQREVAPRERYAQRTFVLNQPFPSA